MPTGFQSLTTWKAGSHTGWANCSIGALDASLAAVRCASLGGYVQEKSELRRTSFFLWLIEAADVAAAPWHPLALRSVHLPERLPPAGLILRAHFPCLSSFALVSTLLALGLAACTVTGG